LKLPFQLPQTRPQKRVDVSCIDCDAVIKALNSNRDQTLRCPVCAPKKRRERAKKWHAKQKADRLVCVPSWDEETIGQIWYILEHPLFRQLPEDDKAWIRNLSPLDNWGTVNLCIKAEIIIKLQRLEEAT